MIKDCEIDEIIFDEGDKIDAVMRELTEEQMQKMQEECWQHFHPAA